MHLFGPRAVPWMTMLIAACTVTASELPPNATSPSATAPRLTGNKRTSNFSLEENLKLVKEFFEQCKQLASEANITALENVPELFSSVLGMLGPTADAILAIVDSFVPGVCFSSCL